MRTFLLLGIALALCAPARAQFVPLAEAQDVDLYGLHMDPASGLLMDSNLQLFYGERGAKVLRYDTFLPSAVVFLVAATIRVAKDGDAGGTEVSDVADRYFGWVPSVGAGDKAWQFTFMDATYGRTFLALGPVEIGIGGDLGLLALQRTKTFSTGPNSNTLAIALGPTFLATTRPMRGLSLLGQAGYQHLLIDGGQGPRFAGSLRGVFALSDGLQIYGGIHASSYTLPIGNSDDAPKVTLTSVWPTFGLRLSDSFSFF